MKNTSISLGNYFNQFVANQVSVGRYKNVSEVIRAGLRLLEDEEAKVIALRNAIQKGVDSPSVENFNFEENLKQLKSAIDYLNNIWNYTYEKWSEAQADKYYSTY